MPSAATADESHFASVDRPATAALRWLTEAFDAQTARGDAAALSAEELAELGRLLRIAWWHAAVNENDDETVIAARVSTMQTLLTAATRAAAAIPSGSIVLALYLRNVINAAWALAWSHDIFYTAVDVVTTEAQRHAAADASGETGRRAWDLLRFMRHEMAVETAVLTGRLHSVERLSGRAVSVATTLVAGIDALPDSPARTTLRVEAGNELVYYRAVRDISTLVHDTLAGRPTDPAAEIPRIEADIATATFNTMDASELRGHLGAADAIAAAIGRDWVYIDEGRVRMIYPFGIRPPARQSPTVVIEAIRAGADDSRRAGGLLGTLQITDVLNRLDLSDAWWQGTDGLGRGYRGATIVLEDLVLERVNPDGSTEVLDVLHPRVQLSELGNNILVFEIALTAAAAYQVAETINLATPAFGDLTEIQDELRLRPAGRPAARIGRIAEAVTDILAGVSELLANAADPVVRTSEVTSRAGSFGVFVTVEQASTVSGGVRTPLTSALDLPGLWGMQPLVHPLPSGAASVADWAMYDVGDVQRFEILHLNEELLASNANVTLLASLRSPEYAVLEIESFVEFAHSLHGMYQGWQDTVLEHAQNIAELLQEAEDTLADADALDAAQEPAGTDARGGIIARLDDLLRRIERAELSLQAFVQSNEAIALFIDSPALVTSPPLRFDLDTVLRSNHYEQLRSRFTYSVRELLGTRLQPLLEVVHRRMQQAYAADEAERTARLEEAQVRRDRASGRIVETIGVGLAIVGLSGLASIVQGGYNWSGPTVWLVVAAILALALSGGILLFYWSGRSAPNNPPAPPTRPGGGSGP